MSVEKFAHTNARLYVCGGMCWSSLSTGAVVGQVDKGKSWGGKPTNAHKAKCRQSPASYYRMVSRGWERGRGKHRQVPATACGGFSLLPTMHSRLSWNTLRALFCYKDALWLTM